MTQSEQRMQVLERLSALADGQSDPSSWIWATAAWRDDPDLRERWRAYHLIGDVLRSDELGSEAGHDSDFLQRFRSRLDAEPIVMVPAARVGDRAPDVPEAVQIAAGSSSLSAAIAVRQRRRLWSASAAVAAGFVAVAGALLVTQGPTFDAPGANLADAALGGSGSARALTVVPVSNTLQSPPAARAGTDVGVRTLEQPVLVTDERYPRDARLDPYMAAHRQAYPPMASGGLIRAETVSMPQR